MATDSQDPVSDCECDPCTTRRRFLEGLAVAAIVGVAAVAEVTPAVAGTPVTDKPTGPRPTDPILPPPPRPPTPKIHTASITSDRTYTVRNLGTAAATVIVQFDEPTTLPPLSNPGRAGGFFPAPALPQQAVIAHTRALGVVPQGGTLALGPASLPGVPTAKALAGVIMSDQPFGFA